MIKENVKNYKVIPIGKRILVKPVKKVETTQSGIILPDSQVQQKPQGRIVSRGPEVCKDLNEGDFIQWSMANSDDSEFMHEGEIHLLMHEGAVLCKLENV
jgi:chaperonin GroES